MPELVQRNQLFVWRFARRCTALGCCLLVILLGSCNVANEPEPPAPDPDDDRTVLDAYEKRYPAFTGPTSGSGFGFSVAISEDLVVVGAPHDGENGAGSGAAYVFAFQNDNWLRVAKLTASDGAADDQFGHAVAAYKDHILVGAYGANNASGAAYLFEREGSRWTETDKVVSQDLAAQDRFGWSLALSDSYAMIGAYEDDDKGTDSGSVFVFEREAKGLSEVQALRPDSLAELDRFGISVALGSTYAVIGASDDDKGGNNAGLAYVYELIDNVWTEVAQLAADDLEERDRFGRAVALSGSYTVVGSYQDDDQGSASGSAYVFKREDSGSWTQMAKLLPSEGAAEDLFGRAVAISGPYIIVGAYRSDAGGDDAGLAYVFERSGETWKEIAQLSGPDPSEGAQFGQAVAMSDAYAVIGAYAETASSKGSAAVFAKE